MHGRLAADPVERQTKAGLPMVTCNVAVDVSGRDSEETMWVGLLAFGHAADELLRASKGSMVAAIGKLTKSRYTGKDGAERESWSLLADSILTVASARPGARKPATAEGAHSAATRRTAAGVRCIGDTPERQLEFDDAIPF